VCCWLIGNCRDEPLTQRRQTSVAHAFPRSVTVLQIFMTRPINEFLTNFEMLTNLNLKASSEFCTYLRKIVNRFIFGSMMLLRKK